MLKLKTVEQFSQFPLATSADLEESPAWREQMEEVAAAEIEDGLALGESNDFEVETDKELVEFTKKTHGMQVYHKIVKVLEEELDQLGVEPLESQIIIDEEPESEQQRNRAESLTAEQYSDFKALTRQDTVVPDQIEEPETPRVDAPSDPFNFESQYEKQFGKGFGKYSESEGEEEEEEEEKSDSESASEEQITKKEVEQINRFLDEGQTVFDFGESFKNPEILCSILKNIKTSLELERGRKIVVDQNASDPFDIISSHLDALGAQERHELNLLTTPEALFGGFETQNVMILLMLKEFYESEPTPRSSLTRSSSLSLSSDEDTKAAYDQPDSSTPSSRMSSELDSEASSMKEEDPSPRGPRPEGKDVDSPRERSPTPDSLNFEGQEREASATDLEVKNEETTNQTDLDSHKIEDDSLRGPRPQPPVIEEKENCPDSRSKLFILSAIFFFALHSPSE
ncbi:Oidioi.mRNA.OKI2018_I69.PAR.g11660.t1.cds [Oikopleura dioica]|uniref:Oidioi.mRNA.OKI2018_I69.PAR.g11660.t1.cds n=1 Tax=Oikopleura dioica TaxID=34765 RepID=A0ABN7RWU7_OIKDI|nr:Oidioi.mRNA.OKI2018_I69.PAR.g11660.t1.cds [Oikopleura dioica]